MELVGRKREIELLQNALKSTQSELVAVYGRRRVGKTFLINKVFAKSKYFEITGLHNGNMTDQLQHFSTELLSQWKSKRKLQEPKSWMEAFGQLSDFISASNSTKKKVIFIDEFPWMDTPKSKFMMGFENFWNSYASKRHDLVVVICGSAAAYMVKKVIRNRGGLHNRITQRIRLAPFNLHETEVFLHQKGIKLTRYDILQLYMVMGGVPHYLEKITKGESVAQIVDRLCFEDGGALKNEFQNIFESLFNQHEKHVAVIKALASKKKGLTRSQLLEISGLPSGGTFTKIVEELTESGFIGLNLPYKKKVKDALYRLTDEFSLFYLKFMQGNKQSGSGTWFTLHKSQSFAAWSGLSFESICLKHVSQLKNALGISAIYSQNASWSGNNAQIDLLIDRADNVITVCEMKFYNQEYTMTKKYADELRAKLFEFKQNALPAKKILFLCMVTTYGIKTNKYSLEQVQNQVKADDLFAF
ncbi:MAG: AAA family ATPase [Bacteroidetes bacterium]|nr:AAA family ATPase [Bacteroidota bacterium]